MATITGLTADRMIAIENASVIDGDVVGDDLILTTKGGSSINAGSVRGPVGPQGPVGSDLVVVTAQQLLDVGISGQIRAGRQLTATDFTNLGLAAPVGLWNLSNLNDSSGNGRNLSNKGSVPFASGINGVASSAAQFAGLTTQGLYIVDTGASDPFRIKTGSIGCWFRTAKRAEYSALIGKRPVADGNHSYWLQIHNNNTLGFQVCGTGVIGASVTGWGISDVCDDRWHFGVGVHDGSLMKIYVDGVLEGFAPAPFALFSGNGPLNIGSFNADGSTTAIYPNFGRIDEAFITNDILSEDQIRNLYCAKISHSLGGIPKSVGLNVKRRKRGAALASGDFPTQPLRLHNFSAGSLSDEGSNGQVLTNTNAVSVAGVDGSQGNAFSFSNASVQHLSSTDAGLPAGTTARSFGAWFKTSTLTGIQVVMSWGSLPSNEEKMYVQAGGGLYCVSGSENLVPAAMPIADGQWHFAVNVDDPSAVEGIKRKLYLDGKLVAININMGSITLGGAGKFRIGCQSDNTNPFIGQIDGAFVCGYALTPEQILALYAKGAQTLGVSPINAGDHVELMTATDLFCVFDVLESQHQIDLVVA